MGVDVYGLVRPSSRERPVAQRAWAGRCIAAALVWALLLCAVGLADEGSPRGQGMLGPDATSVMAPASPNAASIQRLFILLLGISAGILLLVEGVLIYSIVRFRRRRSSAAAEPPQIYGSRPIELAWTVGPLLTVFVLFLIVTRSVVEAQPPVEPENGLRVQVVGHQWWWEYRLLDTEFGDVVVVNELHVPAGAEDAARPVILELESADVIHSFWIPRLAGKTDLVPGRTNHLWFQADEAGTFLGQCAEYCGTQHANMKLVVNVVSPEEFRAWLEHQSQDAVDDPIARDGKRRFMSLACVNCHTIRGTGAVGKFGPDLTHLMSRKTLGAGAFANTRPNLLKWVDNPDQLKPGCNMPSMHLDKQEVESVVSYLETLK